MKTFEYKNLVARQGNDNIIRVSMVADDKRETLLEIEPLKSGNVGQPRFILTNHVFYDLPRLTVTYREAKNKQFLTYWGNLQQLSMMCMDALLASDWNK
jgi:hypothetical protein